MPSELEKFAAYVKTAIQYKSPKMQQILQGALDQAWQAGRGMRAPPGVYRAQLAIAALRDARNTARYDQYRRRPDVKLLTRMFEDGGGRRTPRLPPMSKPEMTRQLIFGAGEPLHASRPAETPRAWSHVLRNPDQQEVGGFRRDVASLRMLTGMGAVARIAGMQMLTDTGATRTGALATAVERKLSDPRIQRVIEHQAPGGVEQLQKHLLVAQGEGPVPAFDIKKLRGG